MSGIWTVFLIGLLGSVHCMGMCGGFVVALTQASVNRRYWQWRQVFYYLGKTATYALLGAAAGGLGQTLGTLFGGMQQVLSLGFGALLVALGLSVLGVFGKLTGAIGRVRWRPFSRLAGGLLKKPSYRAAFALGALNGLLPCGLVYAALAATAALGDAAVGAVAMAVFGLSTIPALFLTAVVSKLMRPVWRSRLNLVGGAVIVLLGLITIARGLSSHVPSHDSMQREEMHHLIDSPAARTIEFR